MAGLRDLGPSEYEKRAYRALLRTEATTAKELSRASDVPVGRIYDVLDSVESRGLARSQSASRPKQYVAVEPETALDRLLAERKREVAERAERCEAVAGELVGELAATTPGEESFWTASTAPRRSGADVLGEQVAEALGGALDRGVKVSLLLGPASAGALPEALAERDGPGSSTDGFEVRTTQDGIGTVGLVDDGEVCLEVPHPLVAGETVAAVDLRDRELAADVRSAFEPRWAGATPLGR